MSKDDPLNKTRDGRPAELHLNETAATKAIAELDALPSRQPGSILGGPIADRQRRRGISKHLGIDVDAIVDGQLDAIFGEEDVPKLLDIPPVAANDDGAPSFYLALELRPRPGLDMSQFADVGTTQIFGAAAIAPEQFTQTFRVFKALDACKAYANRPGSAVLDIIPLVIEHNPDLGF